MKRFSSNFREHICVSILVLKNDSLIDSISHNRIDFQVAEKSGN